MVGEADRVDDLVPVEDLVDVLVRDGVLVAVFELVTVLDGVRDAVFVRDGVNELVSDLEQVDDVVVVEVPDRLGLAPRESAAVGEGVINSTHGQKRRLVPCAEWSQVGGFATPLL